MLRDQYPDLEHSEWIALRLLEGDERIILAVADGEIGRLTAETPPPTAEENP